MATTARNNIVRQVAPASLFESAKNVIDSTSTWNCGDLLFLDDTANLLKPLAEATGDSVGLCGVAVQTLVSGKIKSPYTGTAVDASEAISDIKGPVYGVIASMVLATGVAFAKGDLVYGIDGVAGANAQTVTSVADGSPVGLYQGDTVASATAGQLGEVLIVQNKIAGA